LQRAAANDLASAWPIACCGYADLRAATRRMALGIDPQVEKLTLAADSADN
jgi:hypothetical protein